ncbi:MAG TPA: hypothetical protein VEA38_18895, partial [Terriglobales bacterium]|nr:hypothetical protein [Terriglobales bacterium]
MTRAVLLTLVLACVPAVVAAQHGHGHQQGHAADRAYREQHAAGARGLSAKELDDLREGPAGPEFDQAPFSSVFLTGDEWAAEIANRTVHGILHLGWVPDGRG